ncbi:hypothetical protein CEXT_39431 [Caerostris extrusa]|uniref:Uncharacterized protein n=1 Tax=Caerostris extrusa TaxID=172846 RepID=A0AAV4NW71_CAEEX|nr:hypothetical protein CEXT_39431 [Caerostris extrusa]
MPELHAIISLEDTRLTKNIQNSNTYSLMLPFQILFFSSTLSNSNVSCLHFGYNYHYAKEEDTKRLPISDKSVLFHLPLRRVIMMMKAESKHDTIWDKEGSVKRK